MAKMVTFTEDHHRFTLRVAGLALRDAGTRLLLQGSDRTDFWVLPGGRVHLGETSQQALQRELHEELGLEVERFQLLWISENFFPESAFLNHEVGLYYKVELREAAPIMQEDGPFFGEEPEQDVRLIFRWFPMSDLSQILLYPLWLPEALLRALPDSVQHVVTFEQEL